MFTVQSVIDAVRRTLRDDFTIGDDNFSDNELIDYINRGIRFVPPKDPTATAHTAAIPLVEGVHQSIPADGFYLLNVLYNNLTASAKVGYRKFQPKHAPADVDLSTLRAQIPNFAGASSSPMVVHVIYDVKNPEKFMVYPPNDGNGQLYVTYAKNPTLVSAVGDNVDLPDRFFLAIVYSTLSWALLKDNEDTFNLEKAQGFFAQMANEVAMGAQGITVNSEDDTGNK